MFLAEVVVAVRVYLMCIADLRTGVVMELEEYGVCVGANGMAIAEVFWLSSVWAITLVAEVCFFLAAIHVLNRAREGERIDPVGCEMRKWVLSFHPFFRLPEA